MGRLDKSGLPLAGKPLLHHVAERIAPQVSRLAVSLALGADPGQGAGLAFPILIDGFDRRLGPLAGILSGMDWASGIGADHLVAVPVDGPFLPPDLVLRLGLADTPRLARAGGRQHPTFGTWPVGLRADLRAFLASGAAPRLRDFAARSGALWVDFPDPDAFDNLNTPEDLYRAQERAGGAP